MLRYGFCFVTVITLLVFETNLAIAEEQLLPADPVAYYGACIDRIIEKCEHKQSLRDSASPTLRAHADRMAQKGSYCRGHKDQLIKSMLKHGLEPKSYKVEHFVNQYFHQMQLTVAK